MNFARRKIALLNTHSQAFNLLHAFLKENHHGKCIAEKYKKKADFLI
jgi:hypothetical protein